MNIAILASLDELLAHEGFVFYHTNLIKRGTISSLTEVIPDISCLLLPAEIIILFHLLMHDLWHWLVIWGLLLAFLRANRGQRLPHAHNFVCLPLVLLFFTLHLLCRVNILIWLATPLLSVHLLAYSHFIVLLVINNFSLYVCAFVILHDRFWSAILLQIHTLLTFAFFLDGVFVWLDTPAVP